MCLDDAQHRDADPLEHLAPRSESAHRHFLRRRDDDRGAKCGTV